MLFSPIFRKCFMGIKSLFGFGQPRDKPTDTAESGYSFFFWRNTCGKPVNEMNILVARNRESVNWGIRVPVPRNHLFVLDYSSYIYENICQGLAASAVRRSLYKYPCRNYDSVCTKVNLKSDFHIAEYSCAKKPWFRHSGNQHSGYGNRLWLA